MVGFVDTHDNMKNFDQKFAGKDSGPYVGTVKFTDDPLRQGRLGVNIPSLSQTNNPGPDDCIWCQYLSPFYGAKSVEATNKSDPSDYKLTQHSYGMWFVPPDIDTQVLVIFAKGESAKKSAFWIGCVQQPLTNQQVPGYGASTFTELAADRSTARERGITANATGKTQNYGTDLLPVGEKNRRMVENAVSPESANSFRYPVNDILADQLTSQGLIQDPVRGTTTSSAKRESPSQVFGINTPGRIREDSRSLNIGPEGAAVQPDRNPGNSFVMDDGAIDGTNQLIRLRTASGHQLLMHDTEGVVYIANGSGKAYIEMDTDGTVSVYSEGGINLRSGRDFNLHSDMNINFHAKGSLNFTAEQNVNLNAEMSVHAMAKEAIRVSSQGTLQSYAGTVLSSFSAGTQMHGSDGNFDLAGAEVHFNSQSARAGWGPSWLVPEHAGVGIKVTGGPGGLIDIDDDKPIVAGKPNKIENKTTVTDFVTHEPYDRQSSTARTKKFINEAMEEIKKASVVNDTIERIKKANPGISSTELERIKEELMDQPSIKAVADKLGKLPIKINLPTVNLNDLGISSTELKLIKSELLKQPSIKAVADKLGKVVKLNDNIKLPIKNLNTLVSKADEINKLINLEPKEAVMSFVTGQVAALKDQAISAVRSFFKF